VIGGKELYPRDSDIAKESHLLKPYECRDFSEKRDAPLMPIRLVVGIVRALPASIVFVAAEVIGWIGFCANRASRKRAINNVRTCFPNKSHLYHRKIALKGFQHVVLSAVDLLRTPDTNSEMVRRIKLANKDHITNALREGKGVVIISAHFGNISVLPAAFDGISEHPAYITRRPTRRVSWIIRKARAYQDRYLKPRTTFQSLDSSIAGVVKLAHLLKGGNAVIVLADLTFGSGTVLVDLLGIPYEMSRLPASLAILNRAPLIPVMTLRKVDGTYEVVVEPVIEKPKSSGRKARYAMTKEFAGILERYVRSSPEQWCWTHRQRWLKPLSSA
jgi:KDO2-lipid IV(A) lauroyltransferase